MSDHESTSEGTETVNEREPTDDERRQAEALFSALEGTASATDLPEDALAVAALLRYSRGGDILPEDRKAAIGDEVLERARVLARKAGVAGRRRWQVALAGSLAAVGLSLALVGILSHPMTTPSTTLPLPTMALLQAQMGVAQGEAAAIPRLSAEMAAYRVQFFETLTDRYSKGQ